MENIEALVESAESIWMIAAGLLVLVLGMGVAMRLIRNLDTVRDDRIGPRGPRGTFEGWGVRQDIETDPYRRRGD